jgi:hypothetical protein
MGLSPEDSRELILYFAGVGIAGLLLIALVIALAVRAIRGR